MVTFDNFKNWLAQRFGAYSISYNILPTVCNHIGPQPIELYLTISSLLQSPSIPIEILIEREIDGYLKITNCQILTSIIDNKTHSLTYTFTYNFSDLGLSMSGSCGGNCSGSCGGNSLTPPNSPCDNNNCGNSCDCEKESVPSLYDTDGWNLPKGKSTCLNGTCNHSNKKINYAGGTAFWYCPDCKADLGDA